MRLTNLHPTNSPNNPLNIAINRKLPRRQRPHHKQPGRQSPKRPSQPQLFRDLHQPARRALARQALGLVDFAEHGVGGLGDDCGGEAGDEARAEVDGGVHGVGGGGFVDEVGVDALGDFFVDDEFGHGVGDSVHTREWLDGGGWVWQEGVDVLFEQDRTEARVEGTKPLRLRNLAEPAHQPAREGRLRDEANARRFQRTQRDVREELGAGGGGEVDGGAVVGGILVAQQGDGLLLEELVAAEFEGALQEVAGEGWADTSEQGAGAFVGDDLAEAADHAAVVGCRVELDAGFDAARVVSMAS